MKNISQKDWDSLKEIAKNIMNGIDIANMNDEDYAMFGASLAILSPAITDCLKLDEPPTALQDDPAQVDSFKDIKDELETAEKYLKIFQETKDRDFLQMSYDEVSHCRKFINMAAKDELDVARYQDRLNELAVEISKL